VRDTGRRDTGRRSPEELLEEAEHADAGLRGRLKIFLGYSRGVGKSFRLFDEGRRRRMRGEDVVVAVAHPGQRPDAAAAAAGLEVVPARLVGEVEEIDVPGVVARRPQVCLVDGLAFDNPPGARHPTRRDDVEELLAAGITVLATVGLEEIAEQQELVAATAEGSGTAVIPETFLRRADEIVVVDAPSGDGEAERPTTRLRQRALLLAAEVVDGQLESYLRRHGLVSSWGTQERVLVCMTPRANAARMLAAGRRTVDRFHGELFAVYVVQERLTDEDRRANDRNAARARELGARLEVLEGADPIRTIMEFARAHAITQIFAGHTLTSSRFRRWRKTPLDRLIRDAHGIDLRIFPQREP
jgi:two-component system, OmpR family, sensor histidine kinase KdpD